MLSELLLCVSTKLQIHLHQTSVCFCKTQFVLIDLSKKKNSKWKWSFTPLTWGNKVLVFFSYFFSEIFLYICHSLKYTQIQIF